MKEKQEQIAVVEDLTRTLADVARVDYFATQRLIREIFIPGFNPQEYDIDMKIARKWLSQVPNETVFLSESDTPQSVKRNRFTVGLFIELSKEVHTGDPKYREPVAFSLSSKGLREDLENLKRTGWKDERYRLLDPDMLSFMVFNKYWHILNSRAKLLEGH